jgi:hypothetical protein
LFDRVASLTVGWDTSGWSSLGWQYEGGATSLVLVHLIEYNNITIQL